MNTHKKKDINQTITELYMACLIHPVSVYIDKEEEVIKSSETDREARWMWKSHRYEHVMEIDRNTDASVIKNTILDKLEQIGRDFPIQTSMQNIAMKKK